jgi:DNA polymerase-3 subunit delta'
MQYCQNRGASRFPQKSDDAGIKVHTLADEEILSSFHVKATNRPAVLAPDQADWTSSCRSTRPPPMLYAQSVSFREFLGNEATVKRLRESVRTGHFPQALLLAGPKGAGKYTLALMLARAMNCTNPTESDGLPDFCGRCRNCQKIGAAASLDELVREAVEVREEMRDADKRETRILIQSHPDVLIVPPDPPQLVIKMGQVRQVIHVAYFRPPVEALRSFSIFTSSAFMNEAANSLLKVLEEPPRHTSLILLSENPQELLPTIRSRVVMHRLGALPTAELEDLLARRRPELMPQERSLSARLAEGAVGRALTFDLGSYLSSRQDALVMLKTALRDPDYSQLFQATEKYRGGAEGHEKTISLLRALGRLVEDLLLVIAGTPQLVRNIDLGSELAKLAQGVTADWIAGAARALDDVEQGMRRNLLRSLSLDAMAVTLDRR